MTSKERLDIIKQRVNTIRLNTKIGSRRIADEENAVLLDHIEYNLNKLDELVERDTPMKVDKVDITPLAHYYYYCKACHVSQGSSEVDRSHKHFCYNCGQRLDWSNE